MTFRQLTIVALLGLLISVTGCAVPKDDGQDKSIQKPPQDIVGYLNDVLKDKPRGKVTTLKVTTQIEQVYQWGEGELIEHPTDGNLEGVKIEPGEAKEEDEE